MRCPQCNKVAGYLRHIGEPDEEWVCRQCGTVTKTKNQEESK